jgi:peptidoglycan/LPS O-acetylase OafA/YrhL
LPTLYEWRLQSELSVLRFTWIRVVRLYPLYVFGSALTVIAIFLRVNNYEINADHLTVLIFLSILLLPNYMRIGSIYPFNNMYPFNLPSWSLFLELMANITYASILRFLTTGRLIVIMLVSSLGLVACLYINPYHNLDIGWTLKTLPGGLFRVGYSFFSGVLLYRIFSSKTTPEVTGWYTPFVPWAILASVAALLMSAPGDAVQPYFDFITVVAVFPAIIYLPKFGPN